MRQIQMYQRMVHVVNLLNKDVSGNQDTFNNMIGYKHLEYNQYRALIIMNIKHGDYNQYNKVIQHAT